MSIAKYLEKHNMHLAEKLTNPMCLEFGVTTSEQLDVFIDRHLPDFLLVRLVSIFVLCRWFIAVALLFSPFGQTDNHLPDFIRLRLVSIFIFYFFIIITLALLFSR